jgi:1-acyl-sn-glycerol-3-phosphate acyltransferase
MIPARPARWAIALFEPYVLRLMRRHFCGARLFGDPPAPGSGDAVVLVPNHSTWWDGFFAWLLNRTILQRRLYLMMLDSQLARYRFFRRVGAFGITPGSRAGVLESLRYAAARLAEPGAMLCVFPQGELRPNRVRPLGFRRGLARIVAGSPGPVRLLPLAIRAEHLGEQLPVACFRFGRPMLVAAGEQVDVEKVEEEVTAALDRLEADIVAGEQGKELLRGRRGVDRRWDALRGRRGGRP